MKQSLESLIVRILAMTIAMLISVSANPVTAQTWPQISFGSPISGFIHPTHLASARDGSGRLFVVEQPGRIRIIKDGALVTTPFLDITAHLGTVVGSKGLLSVAFPPDYATKQHFYVNYVDSAGDVVIARYYATSNPDLADANSEELVLIEGPFPAHWGGELAFGPLDGYLYLGIGTGTPQAPDNLGHDLTVLRGKIMRIDVETGNPATYTIPPSNPYATTANARPEIWALGLRNPWSSSFDRLTGDYYIADVGHGTREEVDLQPSGSAGAADYGWNIMEGTLCFPQLTPPPTCDPTGLTLPVFEFNHSLGCASITGGTVYRAALYPSFYGIYFLGDWCSGRLWGLQQTSGTWQSALLFDTTLSIIGFSEDESGQLWVSDYNGGAIYPLLEGPPATTDLSLTQNDSTDPSLAGSPLTYTIQVKNNSSATATGVLVTDTIPASATFLSVSSTQGNCTRSGATVTCRIPSLVASGSAIITLTVNPTAAGTITNVATAETNEPDSNTADNSTTESTAITTPSIQATVQTSVGGPAFKVDGNTYTSTQTFSWAPGSSHTIATTSPQNGGTGVQYVWTKWSDNGAISHTVAPSTNATYTATFKKQYYLTMTHGNGGTASPASGWKNSGAIVSISATPTNNTQVSYSFAGWTGTGAGSYSGLNNPASIKMNGPITEIASFTQNPVQVTVQTSPTGRMFTVEGNTYSATQTFSWQPGSSHTIATTSPQSGNPGIRYNWTRWSDNGAISHTVAPTNNKTYTATFTTQYFLTMNAGIGGTATPASGWKNSGVAVSITAKPASGYSFSNWTGNGTGSYSGTNNPASITMGGPITETAAFTHN